MFVLDSLHISAAVSAHDSRAGGGGCGVCGGEGVRDSDDLTMPDCCSSDNKYLLLALLMKSTFTDSRRTI